MSCTRGCCDTPAEHYRSVATRIGDTKDKRKVTVENTGLAEATITEHWHDRQDVHLKMQPVTRSRSAEPDHAG